MRTRRWGRRAAEPVREAMRSSEECGGQVQRSMPTDEAPVANTPSVGQPNFMRRAAEPVRADMDASEERVAQVRGCIPLNAAPNTSMPSARRPRSTVTREENMRRKQALSERPVSLEVMSAEDVARISVGIDRLDELPAVLSEHGCALVTNVLNLEEIRHFEGLWTADLRRVSDSSASCEAWRSKWQRPLGSKGCVSQAALPQGSFAWAARMHPTVRQIFARIFAEQAECMVTGMDVTFFQASDAESASENRQWLHVDQNHCSGLTHVCFQGVLYIWPSTDGRSSTTALWPGSHGDVFGRMMSDGFSKSKGTKEHGSQSVQVNSMWDCHEREDLAEAACRGARRVPCPAGSLLLWDSRTLHQGWAGGPRLAQPVCWEPRARRTEEVRLRKLYYCAAGLATSHSPSEGRIHGMSWRRPCDTPGRAGVPSCRLEAPYCVVPGREREWHALQEALWSWGSEPQTNAMQVTPAEAKEIESLLRPELVAVL